jgi:hypothetical protein
MIVAVCLSHESERTGNLFNLPLKGCPAYRGSTVLQELSSLSHLQPRTVIVGFGFGWPSLEFLLKVGLYQLD